MPSNEADTPIARPSIRGDSLVELLVGILLLSFLVLGVAPLLMMGIATSAAAEESSRLTVLASDRLEELASLQFDDSDLTAGGSLTESLSDYSVDPVPGQDDLYVRWQVLDESTLLKHIRVAAGSRLAIVGPAREVVIETYRVDNDS